MIDDYRNRQTQAQKIKSRTYALISIEDLTKAALHTALNPLETAI
jgi:hypothetical protein